MEYKITEEDIDYARMQGELAFNRMINEGFYVDIQDMIGDANLTLVKCAKLFDADKGKTFKSYFDNSFRNFVKYKKNMIVRKG